MIKLLGLILITLSLFLPTVCSGAEDDEALIRVVEIRDGFIRSTTMYIEMPANTETTIYMRAAAAKRKGFTTPTIKVAVIRDGFIQNITVLTEIPANAGDTTYMEISAARASGLTRPPPTIDEIEADEERDDTRTMKLVARANIDNGVALATGMTVRQKRQLKRLLFGQ